MAKSSGHYRKMAFAAISFLVFAVALVSVGTNYGLPEAPEIAIPAANLLLPETSPEIPGRTRNEIAPNKYSPSYSNFSGSFWEYPVYRGTTFYQAAPTGPNVNVEVPSLDVDSLLPGNPVTGLGDALKSAPVTVQDQGRKVGDAITQSGQDLPKQLPVTIRPPGGDATNALNPAVPALPNVPNAVPGGLIRR
ncbi:MAG: hypothetical protein KF794_07085 [Xanthobacteraceae bacterium]|nr:hypothetical protein [Xanthobacteraceae bacterium]QYK46427.1 MAG: hypothetical protein KF794_07085 [Xanthobacteraceae bacterium]HMN52504.1 hypothetical protein [Xanthobacteraceae bacterium]